MRVEGEFYLVQYSRVFTQMASEQEWLNHGLEIDIVSEEEGTYASIPGTVTSAIRSVERSINRGDEVIFPRKKCQGRHLEGQLEEEVQ